MYEITGDHHCGCQCDVSSIYLILCFHVILEKNWEYIGAVYQLLIVFQKACDSHRRKVWYDIVIEFDIPVKQVGLIKMFLNKVCREVHMHKHLPFVFPIENGLQLDTVLPLVLALHYHMSSGRSKTKNKEE